MRFAWLIVALSMWGFTLAHQSTAAEAGACEYDSADSLGHALRANSPFSGQWHLREYSGSVGLEFRELAEVFYVVVTSSDENGREDHPREQIAVLRDGKINLHSSGDWTLTLDPKCRLSGIQNHKNGTVRLSLRPSGGAKSSNPGTTLTRSDSPFDQRSRSELVNHLVEQSPFVGEWTWSNRKADIEFDFSHQGDSLLVEWEMESSKGDVTKEILPVKLTSRDQGYVLSFNSRKAPSQGNLELTHDGALAGVIKNKNAYAVIVRAIPSGLGN